MDLRSSKKRKFGGRAFEPTTAPTSPLGPMPDTLAELDAVVGGGALGEPASSATAAFDRIVARRMHEALQRVREEVFAEASALWGTFGAGAARADPATRRALADRAAQLAGHQPAPAGRAHLETGDIGTMVARFLGARDVTALAATSRTMRSELAEGRAEVAESRAIVERARRFVCDRTATRNAVFTELVEMARLDAGASPERVLRVAAHVEAAAGVGDKLGLALRLFLETDARVRSGAPAVLPELRGSVHPTLRAFCEQLEPGTATVRLAYMSGILLRAFRDLRGGFRANIGPYVTLVGPKATLRRGPGPAAPPGATELALVFGVEEGVRPSPESPPMWGGRLVGPKLVGVGRTRGVGLGKAAERLRLMVPGSKVWYDPDPETGELRQCIPTEQLADMLEANGAPRVPIAMAIVAQQQQMAAAAQGPMGPAAAAAAAFLAVLGVGGGGANPMG